MAQSQKDDAGTADNLVSLLLVTFALPKPGASGPLQLERY